MRLHLPVLLSFLALLSSNAHANDTTTENEGNLVIKNTSKSSAEHAAGGAIDKPGEELEYKLYNTIDLTGNLLECTAGYVNDYNSIMMNAQGGAINAASVIFSGNTSINLTLNEAFSKASGMNTDTPCYPASNIYGGAIYADGIVISTTTELNILSNIVYVDYEEGFSGSGQASIYGGAFSAQTIKLTDNKEVLISENKAIGYFSDGSDAATHIYAYGGAIHGNTTMQGNGNVTISKNVADVISGGSEGGAIHGNVDFRNNASITFSENAAKAGSWEPYFYSHGNAGGGAIYTTGSVFMQDNTSITFDGNYAYGHEWAVGGAISGKVELLDNETITFSNNYALSEHNGTAGGAINGNLVLTGNQNVNFISNNICIRDDRNWGSGYSAIGGAVAGGAKIQNNTSVIFDTNGITLVDGDGSGGAMGTGNYTINSNNNLVFRNNYVYATSNDNYCLSCAALGGALSGQTEMENNDSISLINNHVSVSINESYETKQALAVSLGGGIYAQNINFSSNGDILLQLNHAQDLMAGTARGGALALSVYNDSNYTSFGNKTTSLFIRNNAGFVSEKNYTNNFGTYKLESIYLHHNSNEGEINVILSAGENKKIEFYDCIYIASDLAESCVTFNCDYITDDNQIIVQTGDIIFSGLYTEKHLREVKGGVEGTAEEIQNSRTSEVYAITNLHGGRLRVEDGAIYKGYGISAVEGSAATVRVKNAALQHEGYDLTFNSGTTLELAGVNSISGNVLMQEGSILSFDGSESQGMTWVSGNVSFTGAPILSLGDNRSWSANNELLLYAENAVSGWDADTLTILGSAYTTDDIKLLNNDLLVLNFDAGSFQPYFKGVKSFTTRQSGSNAWRYYHALHFDNLGTEGNGGAYTGSLTISYNSEATFRQNTVAPEGETSSNAYAQGGAIYAFGATLQFDNNGTLLFEGNTVRAEFVSENYIYAYLNGGAITGGNVTLDTNKTVTFSGNSVVSAQTTKQDVSESVEGGAISGNSIQLYNNETLQFLNNEASAEAKDSFNSIHSNALGGAISGELTLKGNKNVLFSRNAATVINPNVSAYSIYITAKGGAANSWSSTITDNGTVTFSQNKATAHIDYYGTEYFPDARGSVVSQGGALYGTEILLQNNKELNFSGNSVSMSVNCPGDYPISLETALSAGGAIYGETVKVQGNTAATFSGNSAYAWAAPSYALGGGIYSTEVLIDANKSVLFEENYADTAGGAIFCNTVTLKNNESIKFASNSAAYDGGAIYSTSSVHISDNEEIIFMDNFARGDGGAICNTYAAEPGVISLTNNGNVVFSGNYSNNIGAISTSGSLVIQNNDSVVFEKNLQQRPYEAYRLHSIQVYNGSTLTLSAPEEKSIEIRDSIMTTGNVIINADYIDSSGKAVKQTGDVVFSGACTKQHLDELLERFDEKRTARDLEIQASRTSETWATTHVYGGRLRVEDGAIYQGQGLIAHEGSGATVRVKDAVLNHAGYDLEFNDSSILEIEGDSTIRGKVNLKADSMFRLQKAASLSLHETAEADAATLTVNGFALLSGSATLNASLTLAGGAMLDMDFLDAGAVTLNGALTFGGQVTMGDMLLSTLEEMHRKDEFVTLFTGVTHLELSDSLASESTGRLWVGDVFSNLAGDEHYYFNYEADAGSLSIVYIPEPTTATLSLLVLAGLAARRRRK